MDPAIPSRSGLKLVVAGYVGSLSIGPLVSPGSSGPCESVAWDRRQVPVWVLRLGFVRRWFCLRP
jgi:hypothetical protein